MPCPNTPAHTSTEVWHLAASRGDEHTLAVMLRAGLVHNINDASFSRSNPQCQTAAILCARGGFATCVNLLALAGADVNARDALGFTTPLLAAAFPGHLECSRILINLGADIEARNEEGHSPSMLATIQGDRAMLDLFIKAGSNMLAKDNLDHTHILLAALHGKHTCIQALADAGCPVDSLDVRKKHACFIAISNRSAATLQALLAAGCDATFCDQQGHDLMQLCCIAHEPQCIDALASAGIKPTAHGKNSDIGLYVAHMGLTHCLAALIRAGLDVNHQSQGAFPGTTASMHAAMNGHIDCLRVLINSGADLDTRDMADQSAADIARDLGHHVCADFLDMESTIRKPTAIGSTSSLRI